MLITNSGITYLVVVFAVLILAFIYAYKKSLLKGYLNPDNDDKVHPVWTLQNKCVLALGVTIYLHIAGYIFVKYFSPF